MRFSVLICATLLIAAPFAAVAQDLAGSFQTLKEAVESKKDPAEIKKLAAETSAMARKVAAAGGEAATVKDAKDVDSYTEYALYATASAAPPATAVDLLAALEAQNPKSKYLDEGGYERYFYALGQTGASAKIPAIADKALVSLPNCADLLMVAAQNAIARNQPDRALALGNRLVAAVAKQKMPDGMAAGDWERKKALALGTGHYAAGIASAAKGQYYQADQHLRAALPTAQGNPGMAGLVYYYLGIANYNLGKQTMSKAKVLEGAKFSQQAASVKGFPQANEAAHNSLAMQSEAGKMR
jgi:hypothetical protein